MEMPRPGPEHQRLVRLAGTWQGEDVMHPSPFDPRASKGTLRMTARLALGDLYLMTDWEQLKDGAVSFLEGDCHDDENSTGLRTKMRARRRNAMSPVS
jgi:hypothetical protein